MTIQIQPSQKRHAMHHKTQTCPTFHHPTHALVERNLRRSLHALSILVKGTVRLVALFLHRRAESHQFLRHRLTRGFEDVDERAGEVLLGFAEEGDGFAVLACAAGTVRC